MGRNSMKLWTKSRLLFPVIIVACNAVTATEIDPIDIVFDGWTQGSWQRVFVSQLDVDTENWARAYGENGDPFDV
jgi:hypothetical protein